MSDVVFGNAWHGTLTDSGLVLDDDTVVTEIDCSDSVGLVTQCSYVVPTQNMGLTYYYKTPGIEEATTPESILSIGGKFFNDAIIFGTQRRYSAFSALSVHGSMEWLHYGRGGMWHTVRADFVSIDGSDITINFYRKGQFGAINHDVVSTSTLIAEKTLVGKSCSSTYLNDIDVRYDGRQIVLFQMGLWSSDNTDHAPGLEIFEDSVYQVIVAAWRIDLNEDCDSVTVERIFLAEELDYQTSYDRTACTASGQVYAESDGLGGWTYWEPAFGVLQLNFDSQAIINRVLGAGFDADGILHLITYDYQSNMTGSWLEKSGDIPRGSSVGVDPLDPLPNPVADPNDPDNIYLIDSFRGSYTETEHDFVYEYDIAINDNAVTKKTFSIPIEPVPWGWPITNNVCELRTADGSICRLGPGVIDDTTVAGTQSPKAAFNHRTASVVSSDSPVGFV